MIVGHRTGILPGHFLRNKCTLHTFLPSLFFYHFLPTFVVEFETETKKSLKWMETARQIQTMTTLDQSSAQMNFFYFGYIRIAHLFRKSFFDSKKLGYSCFVFIFS